MKIYLDGIPVATPDPSEKLLKPKFTLRKKDETGETAFGFTGDIEFTGTNYSYLFEQLVTDPNAINNKVELKFIDDCCNPNPEYKFYILPESLEWCEGKCRLTAAAVEATLARDQLNCLKNTMVYDNWNGFQQQLHPRMAYCNELRPNWLHDGLIILTIATWTSFLTIGPVLAVIATVIVVINFIIGVNNTIIDAINALGGSMVHVDPIDIDGDPATNAYQEFNTWIDKLLAISFGCGRKHPSPLVRDYINNVCGKCGLTFQSSILNNPNNDYWLLVYHNAPVNKGVEESDTSTYWIDSNKPILNGKMFLDKLKAPFLADWKIQNNTLVFEAEDYFVPVTPILDLTTLPADDLIEVCWNWTRKPRYSYGNFYYQQEAINSIGNEALNRWGDIVEWNNPYSPLQKDEYKPLIEFAACRFRDDGLDRDVLTTYENLPTISTYIGPYKNSILLNAHVCFLPMLLIWDGQNRDNASVNKFININYPGLAGVVGLNQYYNFPMWIKAGYPGNLYDRFLYKKNPRLSGWKGKDYTAKVRIDCSRLNNLNLEGMIQTSEGLGKIDIIEVDYTTGIITYKGTV